MDANENYILAIDPGPEKSAYVLYDPQERRIRMAKDASDNFYIRSYFADCKFAAIVIERIECYGRPVGQSTFQTCYAIGRFIEKFGEEVVVLMPRREVQLHLCNTTRSKDKHIRQSLIDRFGPDKKAAKGTKKNPGPMYEITGPHLLSVLALAVTYAETRTKAKEQNNGATHS